MNFAPAATLIFSLSLALGLAASAHAKAGPGDVIIGQASVTDGDTIVIREHRIRLHGIDAPELDQPCFTKGNVEFRCGVAVARALDEYVAGRTVACQVMDVDRWGRLIGRCDVPAPRSGPPAGQMNRRLVTNGYAVAMPRYSQEYVGDAETARKNRVGLWAGNFENPSQWRRRNSLR